MSEEMSHIRSEEKSDIVNKEKITHILSEEKICKRRTCMYTHYE